MADISALVAGLATRLKTISGLHVYTRRPFTIDAPAAVFSLEQIDFDTTMSRGSDDIMFLATLFTQMGSDRGEDQLYAYMARSGALSINDAIDGDTTLGGLAMYAAVTRVRAPGIANFGGSDFYGVAFEIVVGV